MVLVFGGCIDYAQPEDYIIPDAFEGTVFVYYSIDDGQELEYQDSRRQYYVPDNGILYTQFQRPDGALDQRFIIGEHTAVYDNKAIEIYPDSFYLYRIVDGKTYASIDTLQTDPPFGSQVDPYKNFAYYVIGRGDTDKDSLFSRAVDIADLVTKVFPEKITEPIQ